MMRIAAKSSLVIWLCVVWQVIAADAPPIANKPTVAVARPAKGNRAPADVRIVVVVDPAPKVLSALSAVFSGTAGRGVQPSPDFLLALAPMLREGPPTELLVASPTNRRCIEERLRSARGAEVWLLQPDRHASLQCDSAHRVFQGDPNEIVREVRSVCCPHPRTVVVADRADRKQALLGCLVAVAHRAPLYLVDRKQPAATQLDADATAARRIECIGRASDWKRFSLPARAERAYLGDADEILALYARSLGLQEAEHVVVTRAPDATPNPQAAALWALAVPYALRHRAAILLVRDGADIEDQILQALAKRHPQAKYVTIFGDRSSLALLEVPDPAAPRAAAPAPKPRAAANDGDEPAEHIDDPEDRSPSAPRRDAPPNAEPQKVDVELLSGIRRGQPCTYRVGRIVGDSLATASLLAAGAGLTHPRDSGPTGWMIANIGEKRLPMLECIARATETGLSARGWLMSAHYGPAAASSPVDRLLAADVVIYQGHTADLEEFGKIAQQAEVLPPSLFLLQGCFTLRQDETMSLLQHGAASVVGTRSNMYSASGGAMAKAFLDALAEGRDAGTSLMIARNYMLALSMIKENRGHQQCGPPRRAAMTFSLCGDPTWKLPCKPSVPAAADRVYAVRRGRRLEVHVPATWPAESRAASYHATTPLGGKLSGVYTARSGKEAEKQLVPQYFALIPMEDWDRREPPTLSSKLPDSRWVSLWDPHNHWLYVLVWGNTVSGKDPGRVFSFDVR